MIWKFQKMQKTTKGLKINQTNILNLKILGMDSAHCAMIVKQAIKTLPGVEKVEVDYNNAQAKIVFNQIKQESMRLKK